MARKLNKVVVAAVAAVAVAGGGAFIAAPKIARLIRPVSKIVAEGDAAAAKGDWESAATSYGKAVYRAGNDMPLQMKYLDALEHTVRGDFDKLQNIRRTQATILSNDPRSVDALRRVMAYQKWDVEHSPGNTSAVRSLAGTADRLLSIVPNDRDAVIAKAASVLEPYTRGLEVRDEDVAAQQAAVEKLVQEKPDDGTAFRMAMSFRRYGLRRVDPNELKTRVAENLAFADAAIAKAPNNAVICAVRSEAVAQAAAILYADNQAKRDAAIKDYTDSLKKAADLAKPGDDAFVGIRANYLQQLERRDPKQAEAGYRKLLEEAPTDRQPRIFLAEFLGRQPNRRDEAVAVLSAPFKPDPDIKARESIDQRFYEMLESVRKTQFRIGALALITDEADRKARLKVIEDEYAALTSDAQISQQYKAPLLRIASGIQLAKGNVTESIATLDSAIKLMNPSPSASPMEQEMLNDALLEYADAQIRLNQTGLARPALTQLVERRPDSFFARAKLADLLIRERNYADAKPQVDFLKAAAGSNIEVQRLDMRLLALNGDQLRTKYKDMAETDRDKRYLKLQVAASLNDLPEMMRLGQLILTDNPADVETLGAYVTAAVSAGKRDDAIAAVAAAVKAKPEEKRFQALADGLAARTPEEQQQVISERMEAITDPFTKALAKGDYLRGQGKPADAIAAYKEAQKLKADDARGFDGQFQTAIISARFEEAEAVLPDLVRLNADQAGGQLRRVQLAGARAAMEKDLAKRQQMFKDATDQAQTLAQQNRDLATASLLYAQLLLQTGDYTAAIDQYGQTLDKSPTNVDALIGITDALLRAERRTEAGDRLATLKSLASPEDARVRELEMNYQLRYGDPLKAIDTLQAQVDKNPTDAQMAGRLGVALEAVAAKREGDEAKKYLTRAGDLYLKSSERFPQDLRFIAMYADVQRRLGNPDAAEAAVEKVAGDPARKNELGVVLLLVDQYVRSNKIDQAVNSLKTLISSTNPAPPEAVQRLAMILMQQNRPQEALAALDLRADDANVQRMRVSLLMDTGNLADARASIEKAIAQHPEPETYVLAAIVALRGGDLDACEGFTNKVLASRPNDAAALFYRGQVRLNRKPADLDGSRDDLVKARDLAPANVEVRLALAEVYRRRGDREAAQVELQRAWASNRDNKVVMLRLVDSYARTTPPSWTAVSRTLEEGKASKQLAADPDLWLVEADTFAQRGDTAKAVASAKTAVKIDPKNQALVQRYFEILLKAKAYREVTQEVDATLTEQPNSWWLYNTKGLALRQPSQKADALKAFDAAFNLASAARDSNAIAVVARSIAQTAGPEAAIAKLDPFADPALQVMAGELEHDAGKIPQAIARLEPIQKQGDAIPAPVMRRLEETLGMCYLESSPVEIAKARSLFERLLKDTPDNITILNNLACVLLMPDAGPNAAAEALKPAQKAWDLINSNESSMLNLVIQDTYGYALVKNNRLDDGIEQLRRCSETATFPDVFVHLAEAYLAKNNLDGAQIALDDAKSRIDQVEKAKGRVDPMLKDKLTQLTSDLSNKRAAQPNG